MKKDYKILLSIFLLFTFLSLLLFWPVFGGKVNLNGNLLVSFWAPYQENLPFKNSGWDQLRIYFPFYKFTFEEFRAGRVPLWNPYLFSGHGHMADFQSAVFYPLNIFGLILGQIEFWHLLRLTPQVLAAFFTFLYLRSLKLSGLASFFGALTFGFSPFVLTWGEEVVMSPHSIVWLPLILWGVEKYLAHPRGGESGPIHLRGEVMVKARKHLEGGEYSGLFPGGVILTVIALGVAFSLLGGYMQTSIYMLIFVAAYLVFNVKHLGGKIALHLGILASVVLGVGLAAVQLLPSAELYFNAARSKVALTAKLYDFLLPPESLVTYLAPDFFGHPATANFFRRGDAQYYEGIMFAGVAALLFALYRIISSFSHSRGGEFGPVHLEYSGLHPGGDLGRGGRGMVVFLTASALVALSTTLDLPTSRLFLSLPIPFLSTSIANRVLFIPAFCLAVLAALGMEKWMRERHEIFKPILVLTGIYAGLAVGLLAIWFFDWSYFAQGKFRSALNVVVSLRNLVVPLVVFVLTVGAIKMAVLGWWTRRVAAGVIIAVAFTHVFFFSQKYFSFSERKYIFPQSEVLQFIAQNQGVARSWGVGESFIENNLASQYFLFWPEGYDSLNNRSYGEFTYAMQGANIRDFVFRADAGLGRGKTEELLGSESRRRLIDMVGVKYVIGESNEERVMSEYNFKKVFDPVVEPGNTSEVGKSDEARYVVFENQTVMPRAFLASNYEGPPNVFEEESKTVKEKSQSEKSRRALILQKLLSETFDWRNVIILEKPSPISPQFGPGTAEITSYRPQEVMVKTKSDQPKLLFLSDNYYPGWKAEVDGERTEILRANYTFRAVPLGPGEHVVRFYYDSDAFKWGLLISAVSLGGLAFWVLGKK